jgi:predicted TIM-barrel fold metal-dependent hydrolase
MNPTRREFLASSAALAGCAASPAPREAPRATVVDTHLHCFAGKDDARFPYHPRGPYRPDAAATPQRLLELMDGAGVDYAIVVHPEPYQDDHRYLTYCLETGGKRLKGTCLFFADRPDSAEMMPAIVKTLPIVASRIHAYAPDRLPPFGKPELRAYWKAIADLGIAVQLHFEPRYAPGFEPLIQEFKETTVIIDHLGRPLQGTPEEHEVVVRWSRFPNTVMKLSAFQPRTQYPHRDLAPVIQRLADAYGADRMIYGGGFGSDATAASYRAARETARSYIAHLPAADQAKVLGGTAARLFRFG